MRKNTILRRSFLEAVITLALIDLAETGASLADSVMTSRMLGSDKVAAIGMAYPIFSFAGIFSGMLGLGLQSLCAEEIGRGNIKKMNRYVSTVFTVGIGVAVSMTILLFLCREPLAVLLGARGDAENLRFETEEYIKGLLIGLLPLLLYPILAPIVQLDGSGRLVRAAVVVGTVTDILMNYVFISAGFGIFGVGLASACSYFANFCLMLIHFLKKNRQLRFAFSKPEWGVLPIVMHRGKNKAIKRLANIIRPLVINNYIISLGGSMAMSALSLRNNVGNFALVISTGIIGAVTMLVSAVYSERSGSDIRYIGKEAHRYILYIICPLAILIAIFAEPFARFLVTDNDEMCRLVAFALRVFSIEMIADTCISSRISYLTAIRQFGKANILTYSQRLFSVVFCVLILGGIFGVKGIICSYAAADILLVLIVFVITEIRSGKVFPSVDDYLMLDDCFRVSVKNAIELDIRSREDASLVAEQIQLFCKGHSFDSKRAFHAALCAEEAAVLLFDHAPPGKKYRMELLVRAIDDDLIIRLRDNGKTDFSFFDMQNMISAENPMSDVGIRIVHKTARELQYYRILKVNYAAMHI